MRTITTTALVGPDHKLTAMVPPDIPPGPRAVVIVLEEAPGPAGGPLTLSPHPVGLADPSCTFRREDLYGDAGR
jgi:hypothetical protein